MPQTRTGRGGGWKDGGSAGVWRSVGPVVETDRYPSAAALGKTGMVHFEQHVFGRYKPYGF